MPCCNLVGALAINGLADEALDMLEAIHRSGSLHLHVAHLAAEPDIAKLAGHPRFQTLLAALGTPDAD